MNFSEIIDRHELLNILLIKTPVKMADIVYFYYLDNIYKDACLSIWSMNALHLKCSDGVLENDSAL